MTSEATGISFGEAAEACAMGKKFRRAGWRMADLYMGESRGRLRMMMAAPDESPFSFQVCDEFWMAEDVAATDWVPFVRRDAAAPEVG